MTKNLRATKSSKFSSVSCVIFCSQPCSDDMWHLSKQGPSLPSAVLCLYDRDDLKGWPRGIYLSEKGFVSFGVEKHSFGFWLISRHI